MTRPIPSSAARLLVSAAALALLAGCASLKPTQMAQAPDDYRERHPIVITDAVHSLDVFPDGGDSLDRRQAEDIAAFAADFRAHGKSGLTAAVPSGSPGASRTLGAIRQHLARNGIGGALQIVPFKADENRGTAPIRLSFRKVQAKVASECGLWPKDLAGSVDKDLIPDTWRNQPYHNLGCAYQTHIAAQTANPLDLVRPRTEGPIDVAKRTKDIEDLRKSTDPSTQWRVPATSISQAVR